MSDLIERLRGLGWKDHIGDEAADEIERLRAENKAQLAELHAISEALGTNEGHSSVDHILALKAQPAQSEPVYAYRRKGQDAFCTCDEARYIELSDKPRLFETTVFYTTPQPSTEVERALIAAEETLHWIAAQPASGAIQSRALVAIASIDAAMKKGE